MGFFLPYPALSGLKNYAYSSQDDSLVSKYILKPFYTKLVQYIPTWVAPNLITLLGLGFSVCSVVKTIVYNSGFDAVMPKWVYFSFAFELFMYQTLDALDGLQARRTKSSSPLGELFDHCVDAINTTLGVISFAAVLNMKPWHILLAEFACTLNFYLSTWEQYHTGTLYLSIFSGPVEGVIMIGLIEAVTGFFGPGIWRTPILFGLSFLDVYMPLFAGGLGLNILAALNNVYKAKGESFMEALKGLWQFAALWTAFGFWINAAPYLLTDPLISLLLTIGMSISLLVGQIITAHITSQPFPRGSALLALPSIGVISHYLAPALGMFPAEVDFYMLSVSLGIAIGVYGCFVTEIVHDITHYLDIGCFYIKHKNAKKE